eukprot:TRINITY_DN27230_c0_g1_i1.p1 TRINITY_DN27230_c0_g1~~TRINITY_DN27230_c0_g1_i1.p1  ORF type:complete len:301 (-),score=71.09 TRINITY_DN27230_c0_g1_i1:60-920(-)
MSSEPLVDPADVDLEVPEDVEQVKRELVKYFGSKDDEEKLESFLDSISDMNFYDYFALMKVDPKQDIETLQSFMKIFMLPMMQFLIPAFLIKNKYENFHWDNGGICPDVDDPLYRFIGGVMFIYSVWQIADAINEGPTIVLNRLAAKHFAITGSKPDFIFAVGWVLQVSCGVLLEVTLYLMFASGDDPFDLVMNCVALNFLLSVDDEWVLNRHKTKGLKAAAWLFKEWRDMAVDNHRKVQETLPHRRSARKRAVGCVSAATKIAHYVVVTLGYSLAAFFVGCRSSW